MFAGNRKWKVPFWLLYLIALWGWAHLLMLWDGLCRLRPGRRRVDTDGDPLGPDGTDGTGDRNSLQL